MVKWVIIENYISYIYNVGLLELCKVVCNFVKDNYDLYYLFENEIIVIIGVSEVIDVVFWMILELGIEVILFVFIYLGYEFIIWLCGVMFVFVDVCEIGFCLIVEVFKNVIIEKIRCIVLLYFFNLIGVILLIEELKDIVDVLKDKNIFVFLDEIYSEFVYE